MLATIIVVWYNLIVLSHSYPSSNCSGINFNWCQCSENVFRFVFENILGA
jgi:hypothetical protein